MLNINAQVYTSCEERFNALVAEVKLTQAERNNLFNLFMWQVDKQIKQDDSAGAYTQKRRTIRNLYQYLNMVDLRDFIQE